MGFYWKALITGFSAAVAIVAVTRLLGDHTSDAFVGFFVTLSVFIAGVEHLSEKMDQIAGLK